MWRRRSVLLCTGQATSHLNMERMGREILDGFRAEGWTATHIDLAAGDPQVLLGALVGRLVAGEFDLMMSLEGMGVVEGADPLLAVAGVRRLYWALDHPYSGWRAVAGLPPGSIVTYATAGEDELCRRRLRSDLTVLRLAHAAAEAPALPWEERDIPALFVGALPPAGRQREDWPARHGPRIAAILAAMDERFEPAADTPLHELAERALAEAGLELPNDAYFALLGAFNLHARERIRLAYGAALRRLPVRFIGPGWPGGRAVDAGTARALAARSRLVLNLQPAWFRSHERVFEGLALGCAVATTGRGHLANARGLPGGEDDDIIAWLGPPEEAADRVAALLADPGALRERAERGRAEQRARHRWRDRVRTLLAALGDDEIAEAAAPRC